MPDYTVFVTGSVWHMLVSNLPVIGDRQSTDLIQDVHACDALETLPVYRHTVGVLQRQTGLCADLTLPLLFIKKREKYEKREVFHFTFPYKCLLVNTFRVFQLQLILVSDANITA